MTYSKDLLVTMVQDALVAYRATVSTVKPWRHSQMSKILQLCESCQSDFVLLCSILKVVEEIDNAASSGIRRFFLKPSRLTHLIKSVLYEYKVLTLEHQEAVHPGEISNVSRLSHEQEPVVMIPDQHLMQQEAIDIVSRVNLLTHN
ncbi:hypothetical protein [Candidatus Synchoanobacter obligatus]|uniref:Response regulatory domain-containing protein n=1 Tax=Candidatus Synchoanobacter obligatus TaxID=2919597 RepID=A0ABT1L6K8_9GAMM|nr:hypothetical protein [Candidatus Synchoanobacter obligatus]MCP8352551.1 hypothetical protein [Candidatus Synchoanobacter obligatus]